MRLNRDVVVKKVVDKSEELLGNITNHILSNEKFLAALQQIISSALETKNKVDKNVQQALSSLNLPSTADMKKFNEKLQELEELVDCVNEKLGSIEKKLNSIPKS